jgi:hypothetical protein
MFRVPQVVSGWEEFRNGGVKIHGVEFGECAVKRKYAIGFDNLSQLLRLKIISLMIYPVCRGTQVSGIGHHILFLNTTIILSGLPAER